MVSKTVKFIINSYHLSWAPRRFLFASHRGLSLVHAWRSNASLSRKTMKVRPGLHSQPKPRGKFGRFRSDWRVPLGVGFQRRTTPVRGGYWWLWVVKKKIGTLEMVLGKRKRKKWRFSKATRNTKAGTLKCFCSWKRKRFSHTSCCIEDRNGQIVDICPMNRHSKFWEDPTVNKCRRVLLPRQLQVASLRSFSR